MVDGITNSRTEFAQTPGNSEVQGSLACCSFVGSQRELDLDLATEQQYLLTQFKCAFKISSVLIRF